MYDSFNLNQVFRNNKRKKKTDLRMEMYGRFLFHQPFVNVAKFQEIIIGN
jgi:hypothetical protein